ncbi:MAG: glycoside hydrolase family 27 protein [Kiritimatiellales bacterium]|nr:glycoside hydrolase family 27 protein [Kiritimatiellales bacterium]
MLFMLPFLGTVAEESVVAEIFPGIVGPLPLAQAPAATNAVPEETAAEPVPLPMVAPKPPMGWNSFDAYDCAINEQQFRNTVEFMEKNLLKYGWEYAVIDYIWFNPKPGDWDNPKRRIGHPDVRLDENGVPIEKLTMDKYGRLMPAVERFPSAANGAGFKPLADWVHGKGMKFGIHIMRGIPLQAWYENLEIMGTHLAAKDIGEPWDTCTWCNNMLGIDATKPGAQEYYNSIFNLYAEWGVDFVKADDTMYPPYHKGEIEMMRNAIDQCGRPMVLSLSCGEAPLSRAGHLAENANMWRISGDFWDEWEKLLHNFDLLNAWSPHIQPNRWPDADMLPIGHLSMNGRPHGPDRMSQFTPDEQVTMMTLWCVARSPLMMGGDLLSSPPETIALLTNSEVLAVNQSSTDNRQVFKTKQGQCCWIATDPATGDRFVALFNLADKPQRVELNFEWEQLRGKYKARDLWQRKDSGPVEKRLGVQLNPHAAALFRLMVVK